MDFPPACGGVPAVPGRGSVLQTWGPYGFLPRLGGSTGVAGEGVGSPDVGPYGFLPRLWGSTGVAGEGVGSPDVGRRRYPLPPGCAGGLIGSLELARVGPRQVGHVVGVVIPAQQELARVLRQ